MVDAGGFLFTECADGPVTVNAGGPHLGKEAVDLFRVRDRAGIMADHEQAPDPRFRQPCLVQKRAEQPQMFRLVADMLGADAGIGEPVIEGGVLGRWLSRGDHLGHPDRDTGRNHLAGKPAHIVRPVTSHRLGGHLQMQAGHRNRQFGKRLAIEAGIKDMGLGRVPNMEMHGSCTSLVASDGRFDSLDNGHRNRRMICLGPARTVGRNHQARKFCGTQKGHVNIRPTSLREMEGQSD